MKMKDALIGKSIAIGIISLFLTIGLSTIITAQDNTKSIPRDAVPVIVLEYKSDGTIERTVVRMSPEQADSFYEEIRDARDLETRLSVYRKYNLISENVSGYTLRAGMEEKAQRMGLTQDKLISLIQRDKTIFHVYRNIFCFVSGDTSGDRFLLIPFGLSLFTAFFSYFTRNSLPSADAIDFIIGGFSFISRGLLGQVDSYSITTTLVGFVGIMTYYWHNTFEGFDFTGVCVYVKARCLY